MPELPEVETIRRNLLDQEIFHRPFELSTPKPTRVLRYQEDGFQGLRRGLVSARFTNAVRRGKNLWLNLDGQDRALCFHLGMSGQLRVVGRKADPLRHERLRIIMEDGPALVFCDQRMFGHVEVRSLVATSDGFPAGLGSDQALLPLGLQHIARDVLDPYLDREAAFRKFRASSQAVKTKLLDQGIISGIGSIYADEGLFRAGIFPGRTAKSLDFTRFEALLQEVGEVMRRALDFGGTSFDTLYVNSWGNPGAFAQELQVYGRCGQDCPRCHAPLDKMVVGGRSSVFCRNCQPPTAASPRKGKP